MRHRTRIGIDLCAGVVVVLVGILAPARALATSWDEPWHDEVVRRATSFVRAKVVAYRTEDHGDATATFTRVAQLAGAAVPVRFEVSDHDDHFGPKVGREYYLFLVAARGEAKRPDAFEVITPTSSIVNITDEGVAATYRHSYHQALVPVALYEASQIAIFQKHHGQRYDEAKMRAIIIAELRRPPATPDRANAVQSAQFFRQHVALELVFHLRGAGIAPAELLALLEPFLDYSFDHVPISATRAVGAVAGDAALQRLWEFINEKRLGFAKVMAIWALRDRKVTEYRTHLEDYLARAETEEIGFGDTDIMDPRIGTRFPKSVRDAVQETLATWPAATVPGARRHGCGHCATSGTSADDDLGLASHLLVLGLAVAWLSSRRQRAIRRRVAKARRPRSGYIRVRVRT